MRGAPHKGLAWLMRRMRSRISAATSGLPGRRRDFLVHTRRKLCGATGRPCRAGPSAGTGANPTRIATTEPTTIGRRAGGARDAVRSCGERPVDDEGRESPPAGRHGPENWRRPERNEQNRAHRGSHHDPTNDHNLCVFRSDRVFGKHRVVVWVEGHPLPQRRVSLNGLQAE